MSPLMTFIKESNKIEGIELYGELEQYEAYCNFMRLKKITIEYILVLAQILYTTSIDHSSTEPVLRSEEGMDVRVGSHTPPKGGEFVGMQLDSLLVGMNTGLFKSPYNIHQLYERLHPLTDCNGRTGRAIWFWVMENNGYKTGLGFLHTWYYQSLENWRELTCQK